MLRQFQKFLNCLGISGNDGYPQLSAKHTGLKGKIMCLNVIYLNLYLQNLGKSTTSKKLNQKYESGLSIDFQ